MQNFGYVTTAGFDSGPSPTEYLANTVTFIFETLLQVDEETSMKWLQTEVSQEEAGTVADSHLLPDIES